MRAVLDPNVIISGLLSPSGNAARLLRAWERGEYELIVSVSLVAELEDGHASCLDVNTGAKILHDSISTYLTGTVNADVSADDQTAACPPINSDKARPRMFNSPAWASVLVYTLSGGHHLRGCASGASI